MENNFELIESAPIGTSPVEGLLKSNEVKTMEMKNINKNNLAAAKAKVEEERMNAEVKFAMEEYRYVMDGIDRCNRSIKVQEEDRKAYEDRLKLFKGK